MTKKIDGLIKDQNHLEFIKNHRVGYNTQTKKVDILPLLEFEQANLNAAHLNQYSIFVKSRQMHFSSLMSAYVAWFAATQYKKNVLVVCPNTSAAREFLNKTRATLQHYFGESWVKNMPDNKSNSIVLSNGSKIQTMGSFKTCGKSEALDLLIFDEAAYIDEIESIWMACGMTLASKKGKCIIYSSVNYENDWFLTTYYNAKKKENDFQPVKRLWSENPYNNASFYENSIIKMGPDTVKQELDCIPRAKETKSNRSNIITFRVDSWMEKEITKKLIQKSAELDENYTISTYIRELILKDLK